MDIHFKAAYGEPVLRAQLRAKPEDFQVDEIPATQASGAGEHCLLLIQKRNTNTDWLAKQLARFAGVKPVAVGYAGKKDRHAITTQWFSVHLVNKPEPDWQGFDCEDYQVLEHARHHKKLRAGDLFGNRFTITLREVEGDRTAIEARLQQLAQDGFPNYFGSQRFGHDGGNLQSALSMFAGKRINNRNQRGLFISAARSLLFNAVLQERIKQDNWRKELSGEIHLYPQTAQVCESPNDSRNADITAPLWGRGRLNSSAEVLALETAVAARYQAYCDGLEHVGLQQERRAIRIAVPELHWQWSDAHSLRLQFILPKGSYATALLHELSGDL